MSLAQIFSTIQGFFSRGFWFGNFLPVAVAGVLHLFIAGRIFHTLSPLELLAESGPQSVRLPLLLAAVVVTAYAVAPLVPWMRGLLNGALLPGWLHELLRREHAAGARNMRDRMRETFLLWGKFQKLRGDWAQRLRQARGLGANLVAAADGAAASREEAEKSLKSARAGINVGGHKTFVLLEAACSDVEKALRLESADRDPLLDRCHRTLLALLNDAVTDAQHAAESMATRSGPESGLRDPQATRMGDVQRHIERYCEDSYAVPFDYLWPRLQLQLPDSGVASDRITALRAQSDFALLSLVMTLTLAAWLPLLAVHDSSPWFLCGLGIGIPLALAFFYQLALQCDLAQAELVRSLVDRFRFEVISNVLRLPLPPTLAAERELWRSVVHAHTRGLVQDLSYRHPAK